MSKPGNWDIYSYCNNDPANFVDPSGHYAWAIGGALLAGGTMYMKFDRHAKNLNYIDNYMEQLSPVAHNLKVGNQDLLSAYNKLEQLRNVSNLNFAKEIAKDTYGNYIPRPDKVSFVEGLWGGIKEFFTGENSERIRNEADTIIDNIYDDLPKGTEINQPEID